MTDKKTFDDMIALLLPHMSDVGSRRALVESALFGCRVLSSLDWSGAPHVFTVQLVRTLLTFGECETGRPAIVMLLEELKGQVGINKQAQIDLLIQQLQSPNTGEKISMIPQAAGFAFLFEIARWAKDELSQRWTYQRQQQAQPVAIAEQRPESPDLQQVWKEITARRSEEEVKRLLKLIRDQGGLILSYEESKTNARKQAVIDGNTMLLENRLRHFDQEIENARGEMRKQAEKLGIQITE